MSDTLSALRAKHSELRFVSYRYKVKDEILSVQYEFILEPGLKFTPSLSIPFFSSDTQVPLLERLIFLTGMVELISYWKLACPRAIKIECGTLDEYEKGWWDHLLRNGLGEFFFQNDISPAIDFTIDTLPGSSDRVKMFSDPSEYSGLTDTLVMVGGGKDSIVSLECVKALSPDSVKALCVNPIPASLHAIKAAGYPDPILVKRSIDPLLFDCNRNGYLNGHTPFSALLSFVGTITAFGNGCLYCVASNESSASEGNSVYQGVEVNHQYSKSYEYEKRFREYASRYHSPIQYFSLLRPLNELQIAGMFSQHKKYYPIFRSCNVTQTLQARSASKESYWCGSCPKCLFTFICLSCFLSLEELEFIFGDLILLRLENEMIIRDLCGKGDHKPFECVGTPEEVQVGLACFLEKLSKTSNANSESVLYTYLSSDISLPASLSALLSRWNDEHFVPPRFLARIIQ
jgi:UDP-N-acetyl-alpha-D-muramoyl-L-alanyl-L-glutamate epimerase